MKVELKPCPFCGGEVIIYLLGSGEWVSECKSCGATVPEQDTKEAAVEAWNRRAEDEHTD